MQKKLIIATLFSIFMMVGCSREGELSGDVFIVTNSAANLKLGLVELSAIPENVMKGFLVSRKSVVDAQISSARQEYETIKGQYDEANRQYQQVKKFAQEGDFGDLRRELDKQDQLSQLKPKLDDAERALAYALSAAPLFEGMPKGIVTATTDADGRFSMKTPTRGKYAVVAHASRQIFGSREEYYWIVWTSPEGEPSQTVTLSNNNLLLSEDDIKAQLTLASAQ